MNINELSKVLNSLKFNFTTNNLNLNVLWFRVMERSKDWVIKRHQHSSLEIHIVKQGQSTVILDDQEFIISAGECYITPPGVYHTQTNYKDTPYIEFSLNIELNLINDINTEEFFIYKSLITNKVTVLKNCKYLIKLFETCLYEVQHKSIGYHLNIQSNILRILIEISRVQRPCNKSYTHDIKKENKHRFHEIELYITDNIKSLISPTSIGEHVYLSSKQVGRIVKSHTGLTTKGLIDKYRYESAKSLLENSELSISYISNELGFSSPFHFSKFFKRLHGTSPTIFRNVY